MAALAVLGLGSLAVSTQLAADGAVRKTQRADRDALQRTLAGLTEQYFNATFLAAKSSADNTDWTLTAKDAAALTRIAKTSPLTSYGAALVSLSGAPIAASTTELPAPTDPGYVPLRKELLQGQPGMSDVMRTPDADVVAFAVPIVKQGPVALLVVYADIRQWALQGYDEKLTIGRGAVPYVVDSHGVVAASGDRSALGRRLDLPTPARPKAMTLGGRDVVVSAGASGRGWHAVTVQAASAYSAGIATSRKHALVALVALLTAVVGLLLVLFHRQHGTQRRLAEERLYDPLTGLAQRNLFDIKLQAALARQGRSRAPFGLLYCDLDGFKGVNDQYGHNVGDRLLRAVAERLEKVVRADDLVARLGGDEFAVVTEDAGETALAALAERVRTAVEVPLTVGATTLTPRISVGWAVARDGDDVEVLMHSADLAMYAAKSARKQVPAQRAPVAEDVTTERV